MTINPFFLLALAGIGLAVWAGKKRRNLTAVGVLLMTPFMLLESAVPSAWLILLTGYACNYLAVMLNGGVMPVTGPMPSESPNHRPYQEGDRVPWLVDWIPLGRFATASLGDVLLLVGLLGLWSPTIGGLVGP